MRRACGGGRGLAPRAVRRSAGGLGADCGLDERAEAGLELRVLLAGCRAAEALVDSADRAVGTHEDRRRIAAHSVEEGQRLGGLRLLRDASQEQRPAHIVRARVLTDLLGVAGVVARVLESQSEDREAARAVLLLQLDEQFVFLA